MAKVPIGGAVKTRMQPFLTEVESEELSTAFLLDAEQKTSSNDFETIISFSPKHEEAKLRRILQYQNILIHQTGKDLGERMFNAFEFAFTNGAEAVVMFGTDSPTFPAEFINTAFEFLEKDAEVVLGETEDGGFYLIGFREFARQIFDGVEWSTKDTFQHTLSNIRNQKLRLKVLPLWYDVDLPGDLERLHSEIKNESNSAPHSEKWFNQNIKYR